MKTPRTTLGTAMSAMPEVELLEARDRLLAFAQSYDAAPETALLNAVWRRAKDLGESASGSWLGYQANVYYRDFKAPPAGVHFDIDHGIGSHYYSASQDWVEHTGQAVFDSLLADDGKAALAAVDVEAERGLAILTSAKLDAASVLAVYLSDHDDPYVSRIAKEIDEAKVASATDIANDRAPKRQMITSDMRAVQRGTTVPPHVKVQSLITAAHQPAAHCRELAERLEKLAAHLTRVARTERRAA